MAKRLQANVWLATCEWATFKTRYGIVTNHAHAPPGVASLEVGVTRVYLTRVYLFVAPIMGIVDDYFGGYDKLLLYTDPETGEVDWDGAAGLRDDVSPVRHSQWDDYRCSFEDNTDDEEHSDQSDMDDDDECDMFCESCRKAVAMDQSVFFAQDDYMGQLKITSSTPRRLLKAGPKRTLQRGRLRALSMGEHDLPRKTLIWVNTIV
eukprot:5354667-Pyramimonas_sp.AAC.1